LPKSGLTTASLIFQRRRFIKYPRSPINFSQPCQVVSKSRSMKTMSNLCLNHLSQKIRLSQQISSPLPVPRVRRCQGSSTRDHDGDDADCDSYHHRSGQKHLRQQDFNREIKKPSSSDPRPRAWLADHLRCKLPQHPRCIGRRLREIASTCARIYREILSGHFSDALANGKRGCRAGRRCIQYMDCVAAPSNHEIID
jgi:hypothetical protein